MTSSDPANRRRSKRVVLQVPVVLLAETSERKQAQEQTQTLVVNAHGGVGASFASSSRALTILPWPSNSTGPPRNSGPSFFHLPIGDCPLLEAAPSRAGTEIRSHIAAQPFPCFRVSYREGAPA